MITNRYVCAENFFESDPVVLTYLNEILDILEKNPNEAENIHWLVEPNVVYNDRQFVEYLKDFNLR